MNTASGHMIRNHEAFERGQHSIRERWEECLGYASAYAPEEFASAVELWDTTVDPPRLLWVDASDHAFSERPRLADKALPGSVQTSDDNVREVDVPGYFGSSRTERRALLHPSVSFHLRQYDHLGRSSPVLGDGNTEAVARLVRSQQDMATGAEAGIRDIFEIERYRGRLQIKQLREYKVGDEWQVATVSGEPWTRMLTDDDLEGLLTQLLPAMRATSQGESALSVEADLYKRLAITTRAAGNILLRLAARFGG